MSKTIFIVVSLLLVLLFVYRTFISSSSPEIINEHKQAGIDYLSENATADGVMITASGLQYKVLREGSGSIHPSPVSRVEVHYEGKLLDGTVFDSSVKRGKPLSFNLNQVIKGWTEGLQLMVEGEKNTLLYTF